MYISQFILLYLGLRNCPWVVMVTGICAWLLFVSLSAAVAYKLLFHRYRDLFTNATMNKNCSESYLSQ